MFAQRLRRGQLADVNLAPNPSTSPPGHRDGPRPTATPTPPTPPPPRHPPTGPAQPGPARATLAANTAHTAALPGHQLTSPTGIPSVTVPCRSPVPSRPVPACRDSPTLTSARFPQSPLRRRPAAARRRCSRAANPGWRPPTPAPTLPHPAAPRSHHHRRRALSASLSPGLVAAHPLPLTHPTLAPSGPHDGPGLGQAYQHCHRDGPRSSYPALPRPRASLPGSPSPPHRPVLARCDRRDSRPESLLSLTPHSRTHHDDDPRLA
jgi:hypothetical protein